MKAAPFEYRRAFSVEEACAWLDEYGDDARLIAGGQSLVPMMAMRLARPAWLIDINDVPELKGIHAEADAVAVAACTRQRDVERDAVVAERAPLVPQALNWVGHVQTRNRGTVGGSLAHADPCAELPLAACVLEARVMVRSIRERRTLSASEFFTGPMTTALAANELIEAVRWPMWREGRVGSAFTEMNMRHGDFAIVAAAAQVTLDRDGRCLRASFGVGGADSTPRAFNDLAATLVGSQLEDAVIATVAEDAAVRLEPGDDLHASAAYRRHLARVLAARALREARERSLAADAGGVAT